jgi:hypothetical protein
MRSLQKSVRVALLLGTLFSPQDGPVLLLGHSYCSGVTWNGIVVTSDCDVFAPAEKPEYGEVQQ